MPAPTTIESFTSLSVAAPARPRPELLAPAGEWEALKAAVANGADAVYFGLSDFNARHRATNFSVEELPTVMRYLHDHNVRGYVTCNTLIFSDELSQIAEYIKSLAAAGVDAVIVQDLGLVRLIRRLAPGLTIHGSTQMTLSDARGVEFLKQLGVERVILARELSVDEIGKISQGTELPLEVFIHGALCVAYSGQCLTSESLGGRSANRGQCAQACRLPYDLVVDGTLRDMGELAYLLSPQDLAAPDLIDDMVKIGVSCFKIEGRLKSAQYVAATTQAYRAALDAALANQPFELSREQSLAMQQSFSRGFTHGFLSGVNHQELVHGRFPKSRGVKLGTVVNRSEFGVTVELEATLFEPAQESSRTPDLPVKPGDGIVFDEGHPDQDEQGGRVMEVRRIAPSHAATQAYHAVPRNGKRDHVVRVELAFRAGDINLASLAIGCLVWKTDDPALRRRLDQSFNREGVRHRAPVRASVYAAVGEPLSIAFQDDQGHIGQATSAILLDAAIRQPLRHEVLTEQLGRLGDTPFELESVRLSTATGTVPDGETVPAMVPKSLLNDLRRQAIDALRKTREAAERRGEIHTAALADMRKEIMFAGAAPPSDVRLSSATASATLPGNRVQEGQPLESTSLTSPNMTVLVRSLDQLRAVLDWQADEGCPPVSLIHCDFEEIRRYETAVELCRAARQPVALATLRIVKPKEDGFLRQIGSYSPDYILVRNLSALRYYQERLPQLRLLGDYSLNVSNELTAALFTEQGIERLVPSYDLNWQQLTALLGRFPATRFESVVHQHMPMFHMEHCVFAHTLSNGKDYRDCGRPCDHHQVDLKDRVGESHPLLADVGCRNTLFNAHAQSAAEYIPRMLQLGLRWFRVELLRESPADAHLLLNRYSRVIAGKEEARATWNQLRVLNQLGVTRGPLDFE